MKKISKLIFQQLILSSLILIIPFQANAQWDHHNCNHDNRDRNSWGHEKWEHGRGDHDRRFEWDNRYKPLSSRYEYQGMNHDSYHQNYPSSYNYNTNYPYNNYNYNYRPHTYDNYSPKSIIREGVQTGRLSDREVADLRDHQREVEQRKDSYLADGKLSWKESQKLQADENSFQKEINHELNDGEKRRGYY